MQQGITFDSGGPDSGGPVRDRKFPHDLVPRIIPGAQSKQIKPVDPSKISTGSDGFRTDPRAAS